MTDKALAARARVLVVDDEEDLASSVSELLASDGYSPQIALDGDAALEMAISGGFALILLDVDLPGCDGFTICSRLRDSGLDTPIVMVSGHSRTEDKVRALQNGADDYIVKPFVVEELLARMQALLRRSRSSSEVPVIEYRFGAVHVDFLKGAVARAGMPVGMSTKELQLLRYLIEHRGSTRSREQALTDVWGYRSTDTRTVDVHVATLRQKLEEDLQQPRYIVTVRGKGYMFCE
jgi:two-component system, OmpR family, alkaline phosphatase synthesis response regulator PhoP